MSRIVLYALASSLLAIGAGAASAQTWPVKPITMVVTYPAGGGADTMARLIARSLAKHWGNLSLLRTNQELAVRSALRLWQRRRPTATP